MSGTQYAANMPGPHTPFIDPVSGNVTQAWYHYLLQLLARTGGTTGTSSSGALAIALAAQAAAAAAQATANIAVDTSEIDFLMDDPGAVPQRLDATLLALALEG